MRPRPPSATLFPYTTLFRSSDAAASDTSGARHRDKRSTGRTDVILRRTIRYLDRRSGVAPLAKKALRYVFPDHWSFLLGERSEEHTSELQSLTNLVCRLLLE